MTLLDASLTPEKLLKPKARNVELLPIVSIVVPFFGYPVLWLGSYNRDSG